MMNPRLQILQQKSSLASDKLKQLQGRRQQLHIDRQTAQETYQIADQSLQELSLVQRLFEKTSNFARTQMKTKFEAIGTAALQASVWPDYKMLIDLDVKDNRPFAEFIIDDGEVANDPDDGRGGGIADIVIMAQRAAVIELEGSDGPIIMDEAGKHVSKEYSPEVAKFLKGYCAQVNRQGILVTHNESLAEIGDRAFRVVKDQKTKIAGVKKI
ncbi:MAG: hypothetical protein WA118_08135 [Carboxydocellales bacterium]